MRHRVFIKTGRAAVILVFLASCFITRTAHAQGFIPTQLETYSGSLNISADKIVYWRKENRYLADGNVVVVTDRFTLTCAQLEVNNETGDVEARGGVHITGDETTVECESFAFNTNSEQGTLVKGTLYIADTHSTIGAEKIEKIGPGTYVIENATYTSCICKKGRKPDWSITTKRIDLEEEGYARAKGATFRIKDTPIFYAPAAIFPVKRRRQSGLLIPEAGYSSRHGFEFALPFYVAAARWWDFTVTQRYLQQRGVKQELEVRWVRRHGREGKLEAYYLDDWKEDENRWAWVYTGRVPLPLGIEWRQDLRWISDNEYVRDFREDGLVESRSRSLESRVIFDQPFGWGEVSVFLRGINDLQGDDIGSQYGYSDTDGDQSYQLPRASLTTSLVRIPHTPVYFGVTSVFDNFYRDSPTGVLEHSDEYTQRADLYSFLTTTFTPYPGVYIVPEAGWRGTGWWEAGGDYDRSTAIGKAEVGLRLYRKWQDRYKHTVEPRVRYVIMHDLGSDLPPPLDFTDTLGDYEVIELNLDQRFFVRRTDKWGAARGLEIVQLEVTQHYHPDDGTWRMLRGQLGVRVSRMLQFDADSNYDLEEGALQYAATGFTLEDKRGDRAEISYRYQGEDEWQFLKNRLRLPITPAVALTYFNFVNLTEGTFADHGGGVMLTPMSKCWSLNAEVSYHTDPDELRANLKLNLFGLGASEPR